MVFLNTNRLQVIDIYPEKYSENVPVSTAIKITFNNDLMTTDPSELDGGITVRKTGVGESVQGSYSYNSKSVIFTPDTLLDTDKEYTVTIIAGHLIDIQGNTLSVNYVSSFRTSESESVSVPELLLPNHNSMQSETPVFSWTDVGSSYDIQIATNTSFDNIVSNSEYMSGTSFTPSSLNFSTQYYWRVRARESGDVGDWSDIRTFYYGAIDDPTDTVTGLSDSSLNVVSVNPNPGEGFVPLNAKTITVQFNDDIDPGSTGNIVVISKPVDGDPSVDPHSVEISNISVNQKVLSITLQSNLAKNLEYKVILDSSISSTSNKSLSEEVEWTFLSLLDPHYTTVEVVRMDIGDFISHLTNADIHKVIHDASKWADIIANVDLNDDTVAYFRCYTRYQTEYKLLNRQILEFASSKGQRKKLGNFEISQGNSLVPDMNTAMAVIRSSLKTCESKLTDGRGKHPVYAVKGGRGHPYPLSQRRF